MPAESDQRGEDEVSALDETIHLTISTAELNSLAADALRRRFTDRFDKALDLLEKNSVKRYLFRPSSRVIWAVHGRTQVYQVIPASNYCSCDDFYFRAMGDEKRVCYHIIAQRLAFALHKYETVELADSAYARITRKWRPRRTKSISP